jgi:hypothetical protein
MTQKKLHSKWNRKTKLKKCKVPISKFTQVCILCHPLASFVRHLCSWWLTFLLFFLFKHIATCKFMKVVIHNKQNYLIIINSWYFASARE